MESIRALSAVKTADPAIRLGVAAADTDTDLYAFQTKAGMQVASLGAGTSVYICGKSTVSGAILTGRLVLYGLPGLISALGQPLAVSETITLTASAQADGPGGKYVSQRQFADPGIAYQAAFYVDTLSSGVWDITLQAV